MLLLTDGRVIGQQDGSPNWSALKPDAYGSYQNGTWAPIAPMSIWRRYYASAVLASGKVLVAGGEGASQAVSYGDDCTSATNYPIARLRYPHDHIVYCRTFDHSTMGIATWQHIVHTMIEVPASAPSGQAHLQIVANGIASDPVEVHVT